MEETSERECSYENEEKCSVKFVYGFDSNGARQVRVQQEPICPPPIPTLAIGLGNDATLKANTTAFYFDFIFPGIVVQDYLEL